MTIFTLNNRLKKSNIQTKHLFLGLCQFRALIVYEKKNIFIFQRNLKFQFTFYVDRVLSVSLFRLRMLFVLVILWIELTSSIPS